FEDEGRLDWVADVSAHRHHARAIGKLSTFRGVRGNGLLIGPGSYLEYGDGKAGNFGANEPFTLALWFTTRNSTGTVVAQRPSRLDGPLVSLSVVEGGALRAHVRQDGGPSPDQLLSKAPVNNGAWRHAALVRGAGRWRCTSTARSRTRRR